MFRKSLEKSRKSLEKSRKSPEKVQKKSRKNPEKVQESVERVQKKIEKKSRKSPEKAEKNSENVQKKWKVSRCGSENTSWHYPDFQGYVSLALPSAVAVLCFTGVEAYLRLAAQPRIVPKWTPPEVNISRRALPVFNL